MLANKDFNEYEKKHIDKLIIHIEPNYFAEEYMLSNSESINQFVVEWIQYVSEILNWTDEFIVYFVYRLYTEQVQFENEISTLNKLNIELSSNSVEMDCDCNCSGDFCDSGICKSTGCGNIMGC